jgi:hypothetical protein
MQESWQHLLRDRASRTLTYNDEQFHILEKIKMGETIRVIVDILTKVNTIIASLEVPVTFSLKNSFAAKRRVFRPSVAHSDRIRIHLLQWILIPLQQ